MFKQILVGVDGGAGGRDAIALAKLIVAAGGELTLAHVVPGDDEAYGGAGATYDAPDAEGAEALLETVREETGVEAHLRWRASSSVGRGLHQLCELIGADLLTMGSSRRGLLGRVLSGMTPERRSAARHVRSRSRRLTTHGGRVHCGRLASGTTALPRASTHCRWPGCWPTHPAPSSQRSRLCRFRQAPSSGQGRSITRPRASSRMRADGSLRSVTSSHTRPTVSPPRS